MKMCRCCGAPATADASGYSECCGEKVEEAAPCSRCGKLISPTYADFGMCGVCEGETMLAFHEFWSNLSPDQRDLIRFHLYRD